MTNIAGRVSRVSAAEAIARPAYEKKGMKNIEPVKIKATATPRATSASKMTVAAFTDVRTKGRV
jgi:hypothetical protein